MRRFLIVGATGNIGNRVASQLVAKDLTVRAMVRNPASVRLPSQIEVVRGDLTVPETIDACVKGVEALFLVWQAPDLTVAAVIDRMAKYVRRIVFVSNQTIRDDREVQDYLVSTLHARIEDAIAASGVKWTFLRPGAFATNARLWWAPQIRLGNVVRWPYARAHAAPIHEADIAAVAVRALIEDSHAGAKYVLTGPQSLMQAEQVEILGRAIGRPLRFEEMPEETALSELSLFFSTPIASMLLGAWRQRVDKPEIITSTVADVTGATARSFYQWAVDHAADFH
jgi:uncharacterized protein YbjT (DUF2867 family)